MTSLVRSLVMWVETTWIWRSGREGLVVMKMKACGVVMTFAHFLIGVECQVPRRRLCDVLDLVVWSHWTYLPSFRVIQHGK